MRPFTTRSTVAVLASAGLVFAACGSDDADTAPEPVDEPTDSDSDTAPEEDADADASGARTDGDSDGAASGDVPTIVVTTNILGDVVSEAVGSAADVITIMPVGADPHDFQASAQEVDAIMNADALIVNGGSFEEGLLDVIESAEAEGVPTFEALSVVSTIEFGEGGHDHSDEEHSEEDHSDEEHSDEEKDEEHDHSDEEHSDEEHSDEEHSDEEHSDEEHSDEEKDDEHDHSDEDHSDEEKDDEHSDDDHSDDDHAHDHSGDDPHFFTDPMRMADAVQGIVEFLQAELAFADAAAVTATTEAYVASLTDLDAEVAALVDSVPEANRVLVTNHEVFGYFADRYGFEVVGAVIPSGSTTDSASAGELAELAEVIEAEGVPAIFSDTSSSDELVQTLADEVGDISVVELFTESLGDADSEGATYLDMVRSNAERISAALA